MLHAFPPSSDDGSHGDPADVAVRLAAPCDVDALRALGGRGPGDGPHLVAERDGVVVAALALADGALLGDPGRAAGPVVDLLRAHADRLGRPVRGMPGGRLRRAGAGLAGVVVALAVAAGAAAAEPSVTVAGAPVRIVPATKAFSIAVRCRSTDDACEGVLDVRTAGAIAPYGSGPATVARVGTFPFRIAAGERVLVGGRVYGPALAQAMRRGRVLLKVTPRAAGGALGAPRSVLFTYRAAG